MLSDPQKGPGEIELAHDACRGIPSYINTIPLKHSSNNNISREKTADSVEA